MNKIKIAGAAAGALLASSIANAGETAELSEIRSMVERMQADYERRIQELERRLEAAEQAAAAAEAKAAKPEPGTADLVVISEPVPKPRRQPESGAVTAGNAFNPQISVILDGNYYNDGVDGAGTELVGEAFQPSHPHGHEDEDDGHAHGGMDQGFNLRSAEVAFSATVDPYFDATTYLTIDGDGDVDLEEAWFRTRNLPYALTLKGGKFLSDFGYINNQHPHQWDFADQNLVYLNLLGPHGLQDTGVQLSWLPETPFYTLLGAELLQGDQERFGAFVDDGEEREETGLGDRDDGPRLWSLYAKVAPDLGYDHALQLGASYLHNVQHQEIHEHDGFENGLEGDAGLWGLDLVYRYDGGGSYGHRSFKLQSEYLRSIKDLTVRGGDPDEIGSSRKFTSDGLYVQGWYGIAPRWQLGVRYDLFGITNKVSGGESEDFGSSDRWTAALTWTPTEYSRLRLQYAYNDILTAPGHREKFDTLWLQFLVSLGAHGAHKF